AHILWYFAIHLRSEAISRHPNPPFHNNPRAAAHDGFSGGPLAVYFFGFRAHTQGSRGVTEDDFGAVSATGGQIHQRSGNGGGGCDGYGGSAHHGMVELAHRHGTNQQIDIRSVDLFTARGHVIRGLGHKRHFRRVLAIGGFRHILDQAHFHGTVRADGFKHGQRFGVAVDVVLRPGALLPELFSLHAHRG